MKDLCKKRKWQRKLGPKLPEFRVNSLRFRGYVAGEKHAPSAVAFLVFSRGLPAQSNDQDDGQNDHYEGQPDQYDVEPEKAIGNANV